MANPVRMDIIMAETKFTASLLRKENPEILTIPGPGLFETFMVFSSTPEYCKVAPRRESIRDPKKPARQHSEITTGEASKGPFEREAAKK